jgi:tetratricopeptide (TPR) repeat protein
VSPAVAWGVLGAVVVVAIVVVVLVAGGSGGDSGAGAPSAAAPQPLQSVPADTSGSYSELVQRANGIYDQGAAQLQSEQWTQASAFFQAAAKVYAAAWKQQSTDPSVGTDFATSLFYGGRIAAAIEQVDEVLAQSPEFQTAWFNKGNYLAEQARTAAEAGQDKAAAEAYAAARVAYQKAVDLDPASSSGQSAKAQLDQLPE